MAVIASSVRYEMSLALSRGAESKDIFFF